MDLQLNGKLALVTGSTAGIGLAIASTLAREGATVIVNGRTEERVKEAVQKMGARGVSGFAGNMSEPSDISRFIAAHPDLDILIHNLGIFFPREFAEITDEEWERIWQVNLMGAVRLSRHYFPRMLSRGHGRVIFISSESAVQIPSEMIHYGVTKTAQIALAGGMARLTLGTAVTVNTVLAGPTRSEGVAPFLKQMAADLETDDAGMERVFFEKVRPSSLLKRFEDPSEVAEMVTFLASPLASATNGAAVRAEGGVVQAIL
jgi:NAD(P)-dependent dehydrogenase (short-subunit alcohol dehydrogenase family)